MKITVEINDLTERSLLWIAFLTGRTIEEVAGMELHRGVATLDGNPWDLFHIALESYCPGMEDRRLAVFRFKRFCEHHKIKMEDYEIEAELSRAAGEIDRDCASLLIHAGEIMGPVDRPAES